MNVSLKNIDAVSTLLKVEIEKNDYAEAWNKSLRSLRQKVEMKGFRKGMVPFGLVKKIYGKQTLLEEINKLVSESTTAYLRDNKVNFLGDPIPNETEQKTIDFDTDENFEFCFDLALKPEFEVEISKNDTLSTYRVVISDEDTDKQVDLYWKNYGSYKKADEGEDNDPALQQPAEMNQEFFDRIFGPGIVKDEADFREHVKKSLSKEYEYEFDYILRNDIHKMLMEKAGDLVFADSILKRWLLLSNEKSTSESIEKEYPKVCRDLKYQLVKGKLVEKYGIRVEKNEIEYMAKLSVSRQLAQQGMYPVPEDTLESYTKDLLQNEEAVNNLIERIKDEKVVMLVKDTITIVEQEVTTEEYKKIMEEQKMKKESV